MSERKKKRRRKEILLSLASLPPSFSQPIIRRTIRMAKVLVLKIVLLQAAHSFFACRRNFFPRIVFFTPQPTVTSQ